MCFKIIWILFWAGVGEGSFSEKKFFLEKIQQNKSSSNALPLQISFLFIIISSFLVFLVFFRQRKWNKEEWRNQEKVVVEFSTWKLVKNILAKQWYNQTIFLSELEEWMTSIKKLQLFCFRFLLFLTTDFTIIFNYQRVQKSLTQDQNRL